MMLAKSLQSAAGNAAADANYIEDVFSTYLYPGSDSAVTITNGVDLAGEGGMVWIKSRSSVTDHYIADSQRIDGSGDFGMLASNLTSAQSFQAGVSSFNADGFSLDGGVTQANRAEGFGPYVSWTFRKQPKFFDVVTWTGDNTDNRAITHALDAAPGFIIIKATNATDSWQALTKFETTNYIELVLNSTVEGTTRNYAANQFLSAKPSTTTFTVNSSYNNASGTTYVAYLFAHDAGGFGESGEDNVISCGSFTADGSGNATVNLGYEPQWLLVKRTDAAGGWFLIDSMRGWPTDSSAARLDANSSDAETTIASYFRPTATGIAVVGLPAGWAYIYIAIRRGPMKVPESGTSVFLPSVKTDSENPQTVDTGFTVDMTWSKGNASSGTANPTVVDRLRGKTRTFAFNALNADGTNANISDLVYSNGYINKTFTGGGATGYGMAFARAPQFFDEVCYTGTSPTNQNLAHNLQAVPELIISHNRASGNNYVYSAALGPNFYLSVDSSMAADGPRSDFWGTPTASIFEVRNNVNNSGETFSAYLFASCPGVSKVGSFTGTGGTQTINCGFTGGARFVLIKATSTTGDWYVWDSARGIVAGNDPYLMLNVAVPQVTDTDWVDTAASGFELSNAGGNLANSNGVSYIFLAIA